MTRSPVAAKSIAVLACVVASFVLLRTCATETRTPAPRGVTHRTEPNRSVARERASSVRGSPDVADPAPTAERALRLVELWTGGSSLAGVPLEWDSGNAVTSADGTFTVPSSRELMLRTVDPGVRLVHERSPFGGPGADDVVLACRMTRVRGRVSAGDGTPIAERCSVVAAPIVSDRAEWISSEARVGSARWLDKHAPHLGRIAAAVRSDGTFEVQVPACDSVVFLATADGYLPATSALNLAAAPATSDVALVLGRPRRLELRVTDEDGNPLHGAAAQYFCVRRGSRESIVPDVEMLIQGVTKAGCSLLDNPKEGTARVAHTVSGRTDGDGISLLLQPADATEEFVVVWSENRASEVIRLGDARWKGDVVEVAMRRIEANVARYRFLERGVVLRNAEVAVLEDTSGFTAGQAPVRTDAEGYIPSTRIVPGRRYHVVIGAGGSTYSGPLTFGKDEDVDVTDLLVDR